MAKQTKTKQSPTGWRVANPRNIPPKVPVLSIKTGEDEEGREIFRDYYEGDSISDPAEWLIADGFVVGGIEGDADA